MRTLAIVLGDQLDHDSDLFDEFDSDADAIWMAEVDHETTYVPAHKLRIAYFFSAMRHFRNESEQQGRTVHYHALTTAPSRDRGRSFSEILGKDIRRYKPDRLRIVQPGDHRVTREIEETANEHNVELEFAPDRHFFCTPEEFQEYAEGRKSLLLENFYRQLRKRDHILMDEEGEPVGGQWNFDHDNRDSFGKQGPPSGLEPLRFEPDDITQEVIDLVEKRYKDHPGSLEHFTLPVTREQAQAHLDHFIKHALPQFGRWEDAMWTDEPFLYHSRLSAPLNVKLLNPRACIEAAIAAYDENHAPLNSVEGFVRQILGWREFIRGIYWLHMPDYAKLNHFDHQRPVPSFFWNGDTEMNCVRQSMQHVLQHGYAHHIHRLMVLGNFAQLWGVHPREFHDWHMAMYVDAIDWVSLPNTLGMSQFGDGGIVGTKPYCSSGNYINKMSNFCQGCRFDHKQRTGPDACPFTTLYWEFMDRHFASLKDNPRMKFAMKNLERYRSDQAEIDGIRKRARELRNDWQPED